MNMYEMIEAYGRGKGEEKMWESIEVISDAVEKDMDEESRHRLMRKVYCVMSGGHYNEEFAREDVSRLCFADMSGRKHYGPYVTEEKAETIYNQVKGNIPHYNMWDWYVTLNMVMSDSSNLLHRWFPDLSDEQLEKHYVELALNWLDDEDNPYGMQKVWSYMNA